MAKDPTSTTVLRNTYAKSFSKRYRIIKGNVTESIVNNDCFSLVNTGLIAAQFDDGLNEANTPSALPDRAFAGQSIEQKEENFMAWYDSLKRSLIWTSLGIGGYWFEAMLEVVYRKGISWARGNIRRNKDVLREFDIDPANIKTDTTSIYQAMWQGDHMDRLKAIFSRAASELSGIDAEERTRIVRELYDGLIAGSSPREIAKNINDRIKNIGQYRSELFARTEIIRAHHLASIEEYRLAGIQGVKVYAEWTTARDSRVCPRCARLDFKKTGRLWKLEDIENKIPLHPQCRCAALPSARRL